MRFCRCWHLLRRRYRGGQRTRRLILLIWLCVLTALGISALNNRDLIRQVSTDLQRWNAVPMDHYRPKAESLDALKRTRSASSGSVRECLYVTAWVITRGNACGWPAAGYRYLGSAFTSAGAGSTCANYTVSTVWRCLMPVNGR